MFSGFNVTEYKRNTKSSLYICDKNPRGKKSFSSYILKKENSMFSRFNVMKYKEVLNLLFSPSVINILGERKNLLVLIF